MNSNPRAIHLDLKVEGNILGKLEVKASANIMKDIPI